MRIGGWMVPAVVLSMLVPAMAQVDTATAQKKLLSKRAAEADAYRKLAEAVKGLQITSDTYVRDFVAESDLIRADMDEFIKGVRLGEPRWFDDLSCEVPAEVTVQKVVEELKSIHTRHYKGNKLKAKDFEQITRRVEKNVIHALGMGAPREDLPPGLPEGVIEQLGGPPIPPQPPIPDLWRQVGPAGRMMAIRAAEIDAKRKLLERINGLRINSNTTVQDFVAQTDEIRTQAMGKVIGATIVRTYLHHDEPIAEVTVEVPVETVLTVIKELHTRSIRGDDVKGTDINEVTKSIQGKTFQATGMGVPPQRVLQAYNARIAEPEQRLPAWATMPIEATGQCPPPDDKAGTPQGKLLAARCAELDAKRRLAEQVHGLKISSTTVVQDFVTQRDDIRAQLDAILVGASIARTRFHEDGTAEVTVSLPGMQVWGVLNDGMRPAQPAAPQQ